MHGLMAVTPGIALKLTQPEPVHLRIISDMLYMAAAAPSTHFNSYLRRRPVGASGGAQHSK